MANPQTATAWLDERETITVAELARMCAFGAEEIGELMEYGVLHPLGEAPSGIVFSAQWVMPLRTAGKLRRAYDLDLFAVGLLLEQLGRIEDLERELRSMRARMPGHAPR